MLHLCMMWCYFIYNSYAYLDRCMIIGNTGVLYGWVEEDGWKKMEEKNKRCEGGREMEKKKLGKRQNI